MTARYLIGDVRRVLATLPENSVDMVMTSPPFLALRSYLPADHPDKALEMGSEPTPGEFIDGLLDVVEAIDRVLAPHGSICIELGDTYSGSGGAGGDYNEDGLRAGQNVFDGSARRNRGGQNGRASMVEKATGGHHMGGQGWPEGKSLCLVPELFRFALAYGFNPLTGRTTPQWRVRNVVRWHRPNPPVGALGDKFRPATSDMVIACKARDRYFDLDAVRQAHKQPEIATPDGARHKAKNHSGANPKSGWKSDNSRIMGNPFGAPPLDTWVIPTQPYAGSHYATYPEALCVWPILAMCPLRVCVTCGQPSRRVTETEQIGSSPNGSAEARVATVGWTDCGHNQWRTGIVLDPFAGSGTTGQVATGHGRDFIGIDLDEKNADLASERIGPLLLEIEDTKERVS